MLKFLHQCSSMSFRFTFNLIQLRTPRDVHLRTISLLKHHPSLKCYSKFHICHRHNAKLSLSHNKNYAVEEEDGFQMVRVKAPPGAADSSTPGHIEWAKTVGARVNVGEVVCIIRFKEDRILEIKSPVSGILAGRRKNEGDTVQHGDELFKIRLGSNAKRKNKKARVVVEKEFFDEEENFSGSTKRVSNKNADSGKKDEDNKEDHSEEFVSEISNMEPEHKQSFGSLQRTSLTHSAMLPHPYTLEGVTPIVQQMATINEVNLDDTLNFIEKFAKPYEMTYGSRLMLRSIFIKAAAHALIAVPGMNVRLVNGVRTEKKDIEITIAFRHLKVLVFHTIKEANKMSYMEITKRILEIEKLVSAGSYKNQKEVRGFTIAMEWQVGSIVGTPSYSQTCTLGLHSVIKRPIFLDNQIKAFPMIYVSLTYERVLIEDEDAVNYLKHFKLYIEDPRHILVHNID